MFDSEGSNETVQAFQSWNVARKKPRILVYWNRQLTDDILSKSRLREIDETTTEDGRTTLDKTTASGPESVRHVDDQGMSRKRTERWSEETQSTGGEYATMATLPSWRLESAFTNVFLSAGARLVDRNSALRTLSASTAVGPEQDLQRIEAKALSGRADYLVEVLPMEEKGSPTGMIFRVKVTRTADTQVIAQFLSAGEADTGPGAFTPGASGDFEWTGPRAPTIDEIGLKLALDTLRRIAN
ncbi:MAG: hypothetical protein K2X34_07580 [Hyphomonadaceae bacterium]|nr:hypothetical protein [Hyphomonadaceae bacterium]